MQHRGLRNSKRNPPAVSLTTHAAAELLLLAASGPAPAPHPALATPVSSRTTRATRATSTAAHAAR